jgi:hypothetical protein
MSHFTTVQTKLKDMVAVKQAIQDLGLTYIESEEPVVVRGYQGTEERAQLVIRATKHYDIGIRQTQQGYIFVADWWGIEMETGLKQEQWIERFTQRYAYHKVLKEILARGFTLEEEEAKAGEIHLTVRKWE